MQLQHLDLDQLKPAKINVRKRGGKDVADLLPSIRSLGIIQPLLVRPNCEGFEVVAGQRRYHALCVLAEEGPADPVPCIVMNEDDDATAIEASLAENIARLPMDEIDQYKAFSALMKQGQSVQDIASRFGVTERLVTQRLAIANLIGPILNAYRKDEIDPQTVRLLTMATKAQQKKWIALFQSDNESAPEGYRLKCWLFGGAEISTDAALFDPADYAGNIVSDLFGDERYFDDAEAFWALQNIAIADAQAAYLADGWSDVIVLDIGGYFPSYEYVDTAKADGGKIYVHIARNGEVTFYEGQLSRKDIARKKAKEGGASAPKNPEITKSMQTYLGLHRHASVRQSLLADTGIALRLIAAHMLAGSGLWRVEAEPQKAERRPIEESLAENPAQAAFKTERNEVAAILGLDFEGALVRNGGAFMVGHDLVATFAKLLTLDDQQVSRVITFAMVETLEAHTAMIEFLGQLMTVDPMEAWSPDDAFFDLLRDKQVINAMVGELAGTSAAKANIAETAQAQKGILKDCLSGKQNPHTENWRPRYMAFPMQAYTDKGSIAAIEAADCLRSG